MEEPGLQSTGNVAAQPRLDPITRRGIAGVLIARLAVNGGIRVVYPFLPLIAAGLDVSLQAIGLFVAARSLAGLAGPLLARAAPARRWSGLMLASQILVAAGCMAVVTASSLPPVARTVVVGAGFAATGLARPLFDLPVQAWLASRVPSPQRGRAIGVTELGWALSLAATVPLAGLLVELGGWQSAFVLVIGLTVAGIVALRALVSPAVATTADLTPPVVARVVGGPVADRGAAADRGAVADRIVVGGAVPRAGKAVSGAALCLAAALTVAAGELLLVTYGAWLTEDFGLSAGQIGSSTLLIAAAELAGGGLVAAVSDRVGFRRTLLAGLLVSAVTYLLLGAIDGNIVLAIVAIGVWFVAFEATVVVLVALASTVGERQGEHARMFGWLMAAIACGNAAGAAIAPALFTSGGIALSGATASVVALVASATVWASTRPARSADRHVVPAGHVTFGKPSLVRAPRGIAEPVHQ